MMSQTLEARNKNGTSLDRAFGNDFHHPSRKLTALGVAASNGRQVKDLVRLMGHPELWELGYANLYSNQGALTKGINNNTLDGFSHDRALNLIELIKDGRYQPAPVRRTHIPKGNGKFRPLGLPSGDEKLVQEVARMILDAIYEPIFSDRSHGFRPGRSCHTALESIKRDWTGTKWFVDVDIKGFFDNIDHGKLIEILSKRILDKRFLRLIKDMLTAGYMEDWTFYKTYSGTPQGGVCSPILANVYLHELDEFLETMKSQMDVGKRRPTTPAYNHLAYQMKQLRKSIEAEKAQGTFSPNASLHLSEYRELERERRTIPSRDPMFTGFKRLQFCRYADDVLIGVIGTKDDARQTMEHVKSFLTKELRLDVSEEKSHINPARQGTLYLGYDVKVIYGNRTIKRYQLEGATYQSQSRARNGKVILSVPKARVIRFCKTRKYGDWGATRSAHRGYLVNHTDLEIIDAYNAEMRGFANYYQLAYDVKMANMNKLYYMWRSSLLATLSAKHSSSISKEYTKLKRSEGLSLRFEVKDAPRYRKVYALRDLRRRDIYDAEVDNLPNINKNLHTHEILQRLNAEICEYCGKSDGYFEVHHVKRVKDLEGKELWERVMISRKRKTLILCRACHHDLHNGVLQSWRYKER
jgi:group II intron reverse transcriptase/maturase